MMTQLLNLFGLPINSNYLNSLNQSFFKVINTNTKTGDSATVWKMFTNKYGTEHEDFVKENYYSSHESEWTSVTGNQLFKPHQ